jgi:hypothetical protein
MEFIRNVLLYYKKPLILVEAPMCVTVNTFKRGTEYVIQLHNNPGPIYRYPNPNQVLGEVNPVYNIKIDVSALGISVRKAYFPRQGKQVFIEDEKICVESIELHQTVILSR